MLGPSPSNPTCPHFLLCKKCGAMPCSLARSLQICLECARGWFMHAACWSGRPLVALRVRSDPLSLWTSSIGPFLANYSLGARNPSAGRLRVGIRRSIDCMDPWARSFFLPGGQDGFASLSADVNVPEKGEKKMVLATDTSKDALRCNQVWMLLRS